MFIRLDFRNVSILEAMMLTKTSKYWIRAGAILGGIAVITGAFAAHGLHDYLIDLYGDKTKSIMGEEIPAARKYLADFKTAAEYQMYHALGIIAVGLLPGSLSTRSRDVAAWSFLLGILLFSGSLYALVLTGYTKLGMITPLGGTLFIVGWVALAMAVNSPGEDVNS